MSQYDDLYEVEDKPKRKRNEDPTTWADAWKALGIFAVVILAVGTISSIIQFTLFRDTWESYMDITLGSSSPELAGLFDSYMTTLQNPLFALIYMLIVIVIMFIALFIVYGMIHLFSTKAQGGQGTLQGLIVRANWLTIGIYVVYGIVGSVITLYMMTQIVGRYEGVNIMESIETLNEFNTFATSLSALSTGSMFIFWLIWTIGISFIAADNYQFSKNKGCVALLLTNVSLFVLFCGCIFALGIGIAGFAASLA